MFAGEGVNRATLITRPRVCRELGQVCGSDGLTYQTPCALNEESVRRESSPGLPELNMVYWGPCLEAPTIISPPEVRCQKYFPF